MIKSLPAGAPAPRTRPLPAGRAVSAARAAVLTAALSLPQGLLALPVAAAQAGLGRGVLVLLAVGALNVAAVAWTARLTAGAYARHGAVPTLTMLAAEHLGGRGRLLATAGGVALFFLALVASVVGLGRSLAELAGAPAWAWGAACGLALLALTGAGPSLSTRLVCWLGLLNMGLLAALLLLILSHAPAAPAPAPAGGAPLAAVGVSLMLFFAPMLTAPVAREVLARGGGAGALAWGSTAGVALSAGLFALWAVGVARVVSAPDLAAAGGTALPPLVAAVPAGRAPATLLGLLLLGMTALRCALVLRALAEEQLARRGGRRGLLAQVPLVLGLLVALALLLAGVGSFTQLIALAGACAASVVSLVIPGMLALARPRRAR